jgi:hypothetical protein
MAVTTLPFSIDRNTEAENETNRDEILRDLPEELRKVAEDHPHVLAYLARMPFEEYGIPTYTAELSRKMGDLSGTPQWGVYPYPAR